MLDWHHLRDTKTSYINHFAFATIISLRLILTSLLLIIHAVVPVFKIPKALSISGTSDYLFDRDFEIREKVLGIDPIRKKHTDV